MPTTALYRISSNEVVKISLKGQPFSDRDTTFWEVLTDPVLPDGSDVRDTSTEPPGPLRVLGYAKIAEPGINTCRNALQVEIDTFVPAETDDDNQMDADAGVDLLQVHPQFRKLMKAIIKGIIKDDNRTLAQWEQFKIDVAAAANLSQLKASVAALPDIAPRTFEEARDYILSQISKDD